MSTPSSHPLPQPSSASKKAAHNIGTPHSMTTPRSVPSPAATRKDQSGKTPVNHPTASSSHGSKTLASTPMMHSLSQNGTGLGASPGQGPFGTPGSSVLHGLGVDMGSATTPNLNMNGGIPTPVLASAVGMMPSVSDMLGTGRKRNEDEDRKVKMGSILKTIGQDTGRVTTTGIQRLARRVGLAPSYDESASEISMAGPGEKFMVVVKMEGSFVHSVLPEIFTCENEKKTEEQIMGLAASKVLKQDLTVPNGILLTSSLNRFATSLNQLARMDELSKGQVDCFKAIEGLHASLKKLHELEKDAVKALKQLKGSSADDRAEHEVLRKRSGRPSIHGNDKIGLSLDYWKPNKHFKDDSAMDIDGERDSEDPAEVWSLRIEAQSLSADMYPSLRVSDAWLPDAFELPSSQNPHDIPWQDPPSTLISTSSTSTDADAMAIDGSQRVPDLRFVARLDPPIVLPLQVAAAILATLGDQYSQQNIMPSLYHLQLLGIKSTDVSIQVVADNELKLQDGETRIHEYVLDVPQGDLGYTLGEVPFSHPRQLIELLPTLRRWASVASLLKTSFHGPKPIQRLADHHVEPNLDDLLAGDGEAENEKIRFDIAFASNSSNTTLAGPNFSAAAPSFSVAVSAADGETSNIVFEVMPNAEIVVTDSSDTADDETKKARYARALMICEDIGLWVEWIKTQKP